MKKQILALFILCALFRASVGRAFSSDSLRNTPVVKVTQNWMPSVVNISTEQIVLLQQNSFWGLYGSQFDEFLKGDSALF